MKKAFLSMVALLMVISVQAQGFDREPNEKKPPVQGAVVNKMPARATAITPTESQMWWGYFSESDWADSQYGYNKAATIDAFIRIPAGTEMVSNSVIKAIRVWFSQDVTKVSDCKIWISRTLPESMDVIDYSQQVSVSSLADGVNEIVLNTPFAVNNTDLYIGYTVSITGQAYFVNVCDNAMPNAFFYRNSNDGVIRDYSSTGRLALQILIEGGTYPTNIAAVEDFGQSTVFKGQSTNIPITIINKGKDPINNFSYVIATNGSSSTAEKTMSITPLAFNGKARVNIGFDSDTEARKYSKTITITKVNGVPNTHPQKSASGSLITVTSSLASLPVVEEFTGTWCGYCPYGTVGMKKVHDKYGDKVALIAVHNGDVMAISAYSPVVGRYASGYPSSSINREGGNIYPYYLVNYIDRAFSRATVGAIELTASWTDEQQTSIKFDTNTKFIYNDNSGSYGIAFVLVEDGLKGEGYQWNQSNFLSGGSGDSDMSFWYNAGSSVSGLEYDHVAVAGWDVLDGISGSVKTSIKADEVQKFSYTGDLATFSLIQDKTKLTAIALLINRENGTIVNASQVKIGNGTPDNPLKGDVNGDNSVNVADIASIIDIMSGVGAAPVSARSADVNGDGEVNVADIGAVIDIMAGKGGDAEPDEKAYTTCPDGNHPHMIDLGLPTGTKWACWNVGADTPEGYGNYYAWGETSPKSVYNWDTYRYGYYNDDGDYSHLVNIGSDIAGTDYDAATANWGTPWRMPSLAQIRELLDNTISTWTTQNGVNGRKFTGSNGGSVFLPAAGRRWDGELSLAGAYGGYWSSTLVESNPYYAFSLYFYSGYSNWSNYSRFSGLTVRPVR